MLFCSIVDTKWVKLRHYVSGWRLQWIIYNHGTTEYRGIFPRYLPWRKISGTAQHYKGPVFKLGCTCIRQYWKMPSSITQSKTQNHNTYTVWVKNPPPPPEIFWHILPKRLEIFSPDFTRLLHAPIYAWLQIFIQLPATLTKSCHIKRDHHHMLKIIISWNACWVVALNTA